MALVVTCDSTVVSSGFANSSVAPFGQFPNETRITALRLADLGTSNGRYTLAAMTTVSHTVILSGPDAGRTELAETVQLRRYASTEPTLSNSDFPVDTLIAGLTFERSPAAPFLVSRQDVLRITGPGTGVMQ